MWEYVDDNVNQGFVSVAKCPGDVNISPDQDMT